MITRLVNILYRPLLLLLGLVLYCVPSLAATIHVPAEQPTIQAGVDAASTGDTVLVADGTYTGAGNINVVISGKAITVKSESGPDTTIIDCEELGRGLTIGPVSSGSVVIEGFTMMNGRAEEADPNAGGGAIYCQEAVLVLDTCRFEENRSYRASSTYNSGRGGAVYIAGTSVVTMQDCTLYHNRAYNWERAPLGGGIACVQSVLNIVDCLLTSNYVSGEDAAYGGGVYGTESTLLVTGSTFIENRNSTDGYYGSFSWGGGIYASWSTIEVDGCDFIDNVARSYSDYGMSSIGGAIAGRYGTSLMVNNSRFVGNDVRNDREEYGGAIYSSEENCSIDNCLFVENTADQIHASSQTATNLIMNGCTVVRGKGNTFIPTHPAGAVYAYIGSIRNCIIRDNPEPQLYIGGNVSVTYSAIEGGWAAGAGNLHEDPLLTTGPNGAGYLSHVAAGQPVDSPCLDAGYPFSPPADGTTRTDSVPDSGRNDMGYHHRPASGLAICPYPDHITREVEEGSTALIETIIELQPCMGGVLEWEVESDRPWLTLEPLSGTSIDEPVPVAATIDPASLSYGDYSASITINAPEALNSPLVIPVNVLVGVVYIGRYPPDLYFEEILLDEPAVDQTFRIWSDDLLTLEWTAGSDAPWLSLDPLSGVSTGEDDDVTVRVDSTGIPAGTHQATITISDPQAVNNPQTIAVEYTINEHLLAYAPDHFMFECIHGDVAPPPQQLEVWNAGYGYMFYQLNVDADWLSCAPRHGHSSGETYVNMVHVDQAGLQPGSYQAMITLSSRYAANSPQYIPVTLTVAATDWEPHLVVGPGPGPENPPLVRIYPPEDDAALLDEFSAYTATGYGIRVSSANLDTDYYDEIITGPGPGEIYGPHVRGFEVDGTPLPGLSFLAYGTNRYGVNVAGGDIDRDGIDEVITGAGPGEVFGPHVRGWNYDGTPGVTPVPGVSFFAYGTPKWGVNVAAGDIDGDGFDEIVTGPGPGAVYGPHVRGWNVDGGPATAIPAVSFLAYGTNKCGVNVTTGDIDGDGIDEIVTGPGPGAMFGPHVRGWNFDGSSVTPLPGCSFFAWQTPPLTHGVKIFAGADLDGDGRDELVAGRGPAPTADSVVKVFTYDGTAVHRWISLEAYPGLSRGANVAAGQF